MEENEILVGLSVIGKRFNVSRNTVRIWWEQGAPIMRFGKGAYRAFFEDLYRWVLKTYSPAGKEDRQ